VTPPSLVARWSLLAVLPFWSVYLAHSMTGPNLPTGFVMAEIPYYCANGREIFERGNGLMYCNPYDTDPDAPAIYFHWLIWLLGFMTSVLRIPPGTSALTVGAVSGVICAWLTFRLVEAVLPTRRRLGLCYLAVMWGGGLLVAAAIVTNLWVGRPPLAELLQYDPFEGWWNLNWGRNLVMPNEAAYHALVAWCWLAAVRDRPWSAVLAAVTLAAAHPFSGIQHLLVTGAWLLARRPRSLQAALPLVALAAATGLFLAYYFLYLPTFPQHREVHGRWSLPWILPIASLVAAGTPVACLAAVRCWRDRAACRPEMTFFLIAAGVSLCLVKHELFMPAKQPLHFTRGYVWMPLALLGLPVVQSLLDRGLSRPLAAIRVAAVVVSGLLAVLDNATFIASQWTQPYDRHQDVRISPAFRDAFAVLDAEGLRGMALVLKPAGDDWEDYDYLLATYTGMTPLLGHPFITPDLEAKRGEVQAWLATGAVSPRIEALEALIVPSDFPPSKLPGGVARWRVLARCGTVTVLVKLATNATVSAP